MKAMHLTDDKLSEAQGNLSVMRFLGDQEKKSKFQNKRSQELERLYNTPHHTRANIRVKFPDGYLLSA